MKPIPKDYEVKEDDIMQLEEYETLEELDNQNDEETAWNSKVIADSNAWHTKVRTVSFSRIPNVLFEYAGVLKLSPEELGFLCMLLSHMRYKDLGEGVVSRIYPSLSRLAEFKIVSTRQRLSTLKDGLVNKKLIKCQTKKAGNYEYDPAGLFAQLNFLVEKDKEIKKRLEYEYDEGTIQDRNDADKYRFGELLVSLTIYKKQLNM